MYTYIHTYILLKHVQYERSYWLWEYVALVQEIVSLYWDSSGFKRDWILFHSLPVQKAGVGARENVYPKSRQQQHKVSRQLCCRAEEEAVLWITGKGKPLANVQVELRRILLNHHKRLAALPGFNFVLQRLPSWLLCFILKKMHTCFLNLLQLHSESEPHFFVSCLCCFKGCVTSYTMFGQQKGRMYVFWNKATLIWRQWFNKLELQDRSLQSWWTQSHFWKATYN